MVKLKKYKLYEVASFEISNVDKKTKGSESSVRLCNFTDVYKNWAITETMDNSFMIASASVGQIKKFLLSKGQIAITKDSETRNDIGIPSYIADDFSDTVLGYHCALITPNSEQLDGKYLNAYLNSSIAKKYFANNAVGSGMRFSLTIDAIKNIPLFLPDITTQHIIGEIFANIDKKIVLNREINRNLEAMARQLYDYWFVQFDFPDENGRPYKSSGGKMVWNEKLKRKIPVSWSILQIEDILDKYPSTKRFDTSEYLNKGKYPIIDQGESYIVGFTNDEENILFKTPAVVFGDHSTRVKFVATPFGRGADGTQILYSRYPCISIWYLFCAVSALEIPNPGYSRHFKYLKELPITVPDSCTAQKFADILRPIFDKWNSVIFENIELQTQRDELLPLLMNGQVSVMPPEVNCDLSHY